MSWEGAKGQKDADKVEIEEATDKIWVDSASNIAEKQMYKTEDVEEHRWCRKIRSLQGEEGEKLKWHYQSW